MNVLMLIINIDRYNRRWCTFLVNGRFLISESWQPLPIPQMEERDVMQQAGLCEANMDRSVVVEEDNKEAMNTNSIICRS